jgi:hypothetical protein
MLAQALEQGFDLRLLPAEEVPTVPRPVSTCVVRQDINGIAGESTVMEIRRT